MSTVSERRNDTGARAEAAVASELRALGFSVTNLNDLVGNCPFADLLARKPGTRLLVQVKGTATMDGKFGTPPGKARALETISNELDCHAIYAFAHFADDGTVIRFATAKYVAELADADEAAYAGENRYHVNIGLFDVAANRLGELLV